MAKKRSKVVTIETEYGNYSEFLTKRFKELSIETGDLIRVKYGEKIVEGNLIAQNQLGNDSTIIIKLENGYNIGIAVGNEVVLEKLDGSVELEKFNVRIPEQRDNLPEISLIATGGTIASRIDYRTGGVVMAMEPEEIFASLPELFDEVSFKDVKSLFTFGSEDLFANEWKVMAKEAAEQINQGTTGVVFTHGTDTMGYSSAILSFMLRDLTAPVVFTGAQRSSDRGSYDGALNLIGAARAAAKSNIASVMVAMHHSTEDDKIQLSRGTRVRKMHTSRRDAFKSINEEPMAIIDRNGKISEVLDELPRRSEGEVILMDGFEENVTLIKMHPGLSPELLDFYVDKGIKGVIIEGTGLGHTPTFPSDEKRSWIPSIERATQEEIFIGMTSQCLHGRVHPYVYRALRTGLQAGVTYLEDMLPETAFLKLGWVLGNFDKTQTTDVMLKNLAGEISYKSKFMEY